MNSHFGSWSPKWTIESSKQHYRGQNPLFWIVFYINGKLLKHKCLQWACMTHLDIWNTSYGQKKGRELDWQFDFQPLKVKNWPDFLACRWRATYRHKVLNEGYNFSLDLIAIKGFQVKLWTPKVMGVLTMGIPGLPLGSLGTKCHLDVALVERHRVYYKGEGDGFPQVRAMVNLMSLKLLVACPITKSAQTMH
jgi:hypothetical protein